MTLIEKVDEREHDEKQVRIGALQKRLNDLWHEEANPVGKIARIQGYGLREYFLVSGKIENVIEWIQRQMSRNKKFNEL